VRVCAAAHGIVELGDAARRCSGASEQAALIVTSLIQEPQVRSVHGSKGPLGQDVGACDQTPLVQIPS
jgi:hypothetical protein